MSLINDALKRAKQTEGKPRPDRSVGVRLEPAESRGGGSAFPVWLVPLVIVAVLLVSSWFFTQWWRQRAASAQADAGSPAAAVPVAGVGAGATVPAVQAPVESRAVAVGTGPTVAGVATGAGAVVGAPSERARASGVVRVNTNLVMRTNPVKEVAPVEMASAPVPVAEVRSVVSGAGGVGVGPAAASAPQTAVAPVVAVKWPELKVQAIFYRRTNPSALINGETLEEGESILGAKVVRIDRQTVVLELQGQTNTLQLGRR